MTSYQTKSPIEPAPGRVAEVDGEIDAAVGREHDRGRTPIAVLRRIAALARWRRIQSARSRRRNGVGTRGETREVIEAVRVGGRGATRVSGERDRDSWDSSFSRVLHAVPIHVVPDEVADLSGGGRCVHVVERELHADVIRDQYRRDGASRRPDDRSWEARPRDFTRYERLWHRAARPRRLARRARARAADTAVHARRWSAVGARARARARAPPRPPPAAPAPPAGPLRTCCSSARSSRARRPSCWWRRAGPRARARRRTSSSPGRGGSPRGARACDGSAASTTLDALYAARSPSCCPRGSRATGCRRWRRWPGTPAIVGDLPIYARRSAAPRCCFRPATPPRSPRRCCASDDPALRERLLAGRAALAPHSWATTRAATRARCWPRRRRDVSFTRRRRAARLRRAAGGPAALASATCASRRSSWSSTRGRATTARRSPPPRRRGGRLEATPASGRRTTRASSWRPTTVTVLLNPDIELLDDALAGSPAAAAARRPLGRRGSSTPTARSSAAPTRARGRPARCCPRSSTARAAARLREPPTLPRGRARTVGWAIAAAWRPGPRPCGGSGRSTRAQFLFFEDLDLCLRARAAGIPTELDPRSRCATRRPATRRAYPASRTSSRAPPPRGRAGALRPRRARARRRRPGADVRVAGGARRGRRAS